MFEFLWASIWMLVKGAGIGFAVAAPVGPIGVLCIRTTLERGRIAGFCAGLGAAVADTIYAAIGAYAVNLVGAFLNAELVWFRLIGGVVLILLGVNLARKEPNIAKAETREVPTGLIADFGMTLVLTLANPTTILSFAGIFAGLSGIIGFSVEAIPALLIGVFLGSAGWWLALSGIVGLIRHRIDHTTMRWINRITGVAIVIFGIYTLAHPLVAELWGQ
jgi:threonine/homoserine/homoserine lactone efflux protein